MLAHWDQLLLLLEAELEQLSGLALQFPVNIQLISSLSSFDYLLQLVVELAVSRRVLKVE
jgi:hypothetical protein